jgi:hypothetical protein
LSRFRLGLIGLLCALFALTAASADAAFPGANGKIVATACETRQPCDVNFFNWTMNPDGSAGSRLVSSPGFFDEDPAYSADGRWIAFARCHEVSGTFHCGIGIVDAHGQNQKVLTPTDGPTDDYPAFSPDGTQIIFTRGSDTWIMGSDGSNPRLLQSGAGNAVFSPDGQHILFSSGGTLMLVPAGGGTPTAVPGSSGNDSSPDFSPDGTRVTFRECTSTCHIAVSGIDGSDRHAVTSPPAGADDSEPAFSPDGSTIVFERSLAPADEPLFIVDPSGSGTPRQITTAYFFKPNWGRVPTPSVDSPPTIGGLPARVGHTLSVTPGAANWGGATSFQWIRCAASCSPIASATATTYKLTGADKGMTLKVRQTQSDAGGSASGDSAATAAVAGEPGAKIAHSGPVSSHGTALITLSCPTTQSGFCKGKLTVTGSAATSARKLGSGSYKIRAGNRAKVKVKLSKRARAVLARRHKLGVKATARSRDDAGNLTTTRARVMLKPAHRHRGG